jgi:hypothetical protein
MGSRSPLGILVPAALVGLAIACNGVAPVPIAAAAGPVPDPRSPSSGSTVPSVMVLPSFFGLRAGESFALDTGPGAGVRATVTLVRSGPRGERAVVADVAGGGWLYLRHAAGRVTGSVESRTQRLRFLPVAGGPAAAARAAVVPALPPSVTPCRARRRRAITAMAQSPPTLATLTPAISMEPQTVRVGVVSTAAARDWASLSAKDIDAQIAESLDVLQSALDQSGLQVTIDAAPHHGLETPGPDPATVEAVLEQVTAASPASPWGDVVAYREEESADVVVVIVAPEGGPSGVAYLGDGYGKGDDQSALGFVVVSVQDLDGSLSVPHEIGHLMGCDHDAADPQARGMFPWSRANRFTAEYQRFRTVVSQPNGEWYAVPRYSGPEALYFGAPTGVAASGETMSGADNVATIRFTAPFVAAFRPRAAPPEQR